MNPKCSQCTNKAMWQIEGNILCLDCYSKFIDVSHRQLGILASLANQAVDDMESIVGLPPGSLGGRLNVPSPRATINTGPNTYNNIQVDNSIVGAINTGSIKKLDIMMSAMMQGGNNQELADVFKNLTQAILDATDLEQSDKDSALECLSFLSEEAFTPETNRRLTMGKAAISKLEQILSNVGSIASVWSIAKPWLDSLFG